MTRIEIKNFNPEFIARVKKTKEETRVRHEKIFADFKQKWVDSGSEMSFHEWTRDYINKNAINK